VLAQRLSANGTAPAAAEGAYNRLVPFSPQFSAALIQNTTLLYICPSERLSIRLPHAAIT